MKAHDVFNFIKLKTVISPFKEIWQSWFSILRDGYRILDSLSVEHGFRIPVISGIQSTLGPLFQIPRKKFPRFQTWGDSDPKINTFSVKLKSVNWASNYSRLSVHVVLVTAWCSCHYILEKGVCGPGEKVAGTVVFQHQLGMIVKQL